MTPGNTTAPHSRRAAPRPTQTRMTQLPTLFSPTSHRRLRQSKPLRRLENDVHRPVVQNQPAKTPQTPGPPPPPGIHAESLLLEIVALTLQLTTQPCGEKKKNNGWSQCEFDTATAVARRSCRSCAPPLPRSRDRRPRNTDVTKASPHVLSESATSFPTPIRIKRLDARPTTACFPFRPPTLVGRELATGNDPSLSTTPSDTITYNHCAGLFFFLVPSLVRSLGELARKLQSKGTCSTSVSFTPAHSPGPRPLPKNTPKVRNLYTTYNPATCANIPTPTTAAQKTKRKQ